MDNQDELLVVDLLVNIFGNSHLHNEMRAQISFDCPVCSHDIKGSDKGDGKGNLEINYSQHVYKCWACSETHGTHGHLGRLIDKYGSKKDKQFYTLVRPDEFVKDHRKYKTLRIFYTN